MAEYPVRMLSCCLRSCLRPPTYMIHVGQSSILLLCEPCAGLWSYAYRAPLLTLGETLDVADAFLPVKRGKAIVGFQQQAPT